MRSLSNSRVRYGAAGTSLFRPPVRAETVVPLRAYCFLPTPVVRASAEQCPSRNQAPPAPEAPPAASSSGPQQDPDGPAMRSLQTTERAPLASGRQLLARP